MATFNLVLALISREPRWADTAELSGRADNSTGGSITTRRAHTRIQRNVAQLTCEMLQLNLVSKYFPINVLPAYPA